MRTLVFNVFLVSMALTISIAQATPVIYIDDSDGILGKVDVPTGNVTVIGNMGVVLTDIAFAPNGDLYGLSFTNLYKINATNANVTLIGLTGVSDANSLVFGADGKLYAAGIVSKNLYQVNPITGVATS